MITNNPPKQKRSPLNRVGEDSPISEDWTRRATAKAEANLKKWGVQYFDTLGLAIAEECGELAQAILKNRDEKGDLRRITEEALDLAELCFQVLVTMVEAHGEIFLSDVGKAEGARQAGQITEALESVLEI